MDDKNFSKTNLGNYFIEINNVKYFSEKIKNIYELYAYKKELLDDGVISPIKNNENTHKPLVNFTAISSENFSKDIILHMSSKKALKISSDLSCPFWKYHLYEPFFLSFL